MKKETRLQLRQAALSSTMSSVSLVGAQPGIDGETATEIILKEADKIYEWLCKPEVDNKIRPIINSASSLDERVLICIEDEILQIKIGDNDVAEISIPKKDAYYIAECLRRLHKPNLNQPKL